ncbi:ABC-2 type transport system ATP-binding protein [Melghiribacillus thermohalophilus]|uniref:ABC-2 type transport system ATP-binding protein n=1 Tax=Melghiribacillus thermohalophilus TaxID=1324956 RepID=A0A4V2V102_9BACI|nr:ABC transporter ATP-binding protein [Melghiribacillus thermohalophilus]TCT19332.1 ABC-2 type transport system ATP-binding protein [Melghiribacillus thermohalophilus]
MLKIRNITKQYDNIYALNQVNVTISSAEIVGIIGRNGAGKTTFLEIIAGLVEPTRGEIVINNKKNFDQKLIGYLEDDPFFYEYLTVKEVIHYFSLMQNLSISSDVSDQLLKEYRLLDKKDYKIKDLSRGMKQKLGFLLTILHDPEILLLDEPFTGLDPTNLISMKKKLNELKDRGKTIIISTHILSFASDICDRILLLDRGEIKYEAEGQNLNEKKLEALFSEYIK